MKGVIALRYDTGHPDPMFMPPQQKAGDASARKTRKIVCPTCSHIQSVYYDPNRGFTTHRCHYCGSITDLHPGRWISSKEAKQKADELLRRANERT